MSNIKVTYNPLAKTGKHPEQDFNLDIAHKAQNFHKGFAEYKPTPLADLSHLAQKVGVKGIYVKDESYRLGSNAFKALGGSYAIGTCLANRLGEDLSELSVEKLKSAEVSARLGDIEFITATDGNHGRGIAWTAKQLGRKAHIYMPAGTVPRRVEHITKLGGEVTVTDKNFDDTARMAYEISKEKGWIMTQDTTFEGYYDFPKWCMQGYTTMSYEAYKTLEEKGIHPTHIFIQAGAGSLAGSVAGFFSSVYTGDKKPYIVIAEAANCDCIRRTAENGGDSLVAVDGDLKTIMAGLSVGEVCSLGWNVLREYADAFVACEDETSAYGMRILGAPKTGDDRVISGESGALGFGLAAELLLKPEFKEVRDSFDIDENSVILCFNTEGDTDPENYEKIVWDGAYPLK